VTLDKQQVECLARAALTAALTADGLEVARPERDAGIDLLAYTINRLRVAPIQMKAATETGWSIDRKYGQVDGLVMVYVWNARSLGTRSSLEQGVHSISGRYPPGLRRNHGQTLTHERSLQSCQAQRDRPVGPHRSRRPSCQEHRRRPNARARWLLATSLEVAAMSSYTEAAREKLSPEVMHMYEAAATRCGFDLEIFLATECEILDANGDVQMGPTDVVILNQMVFNTMHERGQLPVVPQWTGQEFAPPGKRRWRR